MTLWQNGKTAKRETVREATHSSLNVNNMAKSVKIINTTVGFRVLQAYVGFRVLKTHMGSLKSE